MKKSNVVISFEDKTQTNLLESKLKTMKKFSDKDYYQSRVHKSIQKKLELDTEFWNRFIRELFYKIKTNCYVIIKGLPFDDNDKLLIGFISIIGNPIEPYQMSDTHMVRRQTPGEVTYDQDVYLHTDGAHWPVQNDFTALQCYKKDQKGKGLSRIVPINNVIENLKNDGLSSLITSLSKTRYPFLLHRAFGNGGIQKRVILTKTKTEGEDKPHVRFAARYIENTVKKFKINLDSDLMNNVLLFERKANSIAAKTQFLLQEGDLLIYDNKRVLHGRTDAPINSKRVIKKIKINVDRKKIFNIPEVLDD